MIDKALSLVEEGAVTIPEAMRITGFGRTFLYEAMAKGDLPYIKIGAARRIPRRALALWLARGLMIGEDPLLADDAAGHRKGKAS